MAPIRSRLLGWLSLILLAGTSCSYSAKPNGAESRAEAPWSGESGGLQAKLSLRRSHVSNGTGIIAIYLELRNTSDEGEPMYVSGLGSLQFKVTDEDGREIPESNGLFNGPGFVAPDLVLPHDSTMRFRIGPCGLGIPGDQAAFVDLGPTAGWVLPQDGRRYYLQATYEIKEAKEIVQPKLKMRIPGYYWQGRLELPPVRIPTEPEPVDPATIGPKIEELGALMLGKDGRKSEAAGRDLSLIDDPRVIPWYIGAMKTRNYGLKFNALDRLSRFKGDEALSGLKIGMATQDEDISITTTDEVAQSSAENIRHSAALALARSPLPDAKKLLWSMENDPAFAVRIIVVQAAAREKSPESQGLLQRLAKDSNPLVQKEAERLLKTRE
jgi:hypothetical protein